MPFAAHSQMEQLRWLVRSMPRPDGRRYHAALEESTRALPVLQLHGGRDGLRPASRAALSKETAALVASALPVRAAAAGGALPAEEAPERSPSCCLAWLREAVPVVTA